jgi:hypothetical protein
MTRTGALPHRVTIIRRTVTGRDGRGNDTITDTIVAAGVPARVDEVLEVEDVRDRDRLETNYQVDLPRSWGGIDLDLDPRDELIFGGLTLRLRGPANVVSDHAGRDSHVELDAFRVVG